MGKIYVIKEETTFGPFFSTKSKAKAYLKEIKDVDDTSTDVEDMLKGQHSYINVIEVELDDEAVSFDG